jgi:hypothetical protein
MADNPDATRIDGGMLGEGGVAVGGDVSQEG